MANFIKWLDKNGIPAEIKKSTEGKDFVFIPATGEFKESYELAIKYLKRVHANYEFQFRANYESALFIF